MRYKSKVLAHFPDARLATIDRYDDGGPRYQRVVAGPELDEVILDIHTHGDGWEIGARHSQRATMAWRSAYFWIVRNRAALQQLAAERRPAVRTVTVDEIFDNPTGWLTGRKA